MKYFLILTHVFSQIFKVTPWFAFLILFLSLKDRLSFYNTRKVARTLDVDQVRKQSVKNKLPVLWEYEMVC